MHAARHRNFAALIFIGVFLTACIAQNRQATPFHAYDTFKSDARPWTKLPDEQASHFSFAVFTDLTGGERAGVFDVAVAQLNLLQPELVLNIGDLIQGDTEDIETIEAQWESFDRRADRLQAPLFYTGGNHDLSNQALKRIWRERYGRTYYHFVHKNVLFLVLDTEDMSSQRSDEVQKIRDQALTVINEQGMQAYPGTEYARLPEQNAGSISAKQSRYFLDVLAKHEDVRWTFLLMHKAPWENKDEQDFSAIEQALMSRPYTVFHGHAHSYQHLQRQGRDYIRLATTGGVQLPGRGQSVDHITLVTVEDKQVEIANLLLQGILDKTGHIPLNGESLCFEVSACNTKNMLVTQ